MEKEDLLTEDVKNEDVETQANAVEGEGTGEGESPTAEPANPDSVAEVENLDEEVRKIFPEMELPDGAKLNGFIVETLSRFKNADDRIDEALSNNPEFAQVLKQMLEGEDAIVAMLNVISPEEYVELAQTAGTAAKEARDARVKRLGEIRDWEKTRADNLQISEQEVRAFQQETGKTDEEIIQLINTLEEINNAMNDGKVTKKELKMIETLLNADSNAAMAAEAAAVAERNKSIDAKRTQDFSVRGDGLPNIGTGASLASGLNPLEGSIFDGVGRKSVFDQYYEQHPKVS